MPRQITSRLLAAALFAGCSCAAVAGTTTPPLSTDAIQESGLNDKQAKEVLRIVLLHEGYRINRKGMFISDPLVNEKGEPVFPGYAELSLGYDTPAAGATEYPGLFAVSRSTGDVWEINLCKRYAFAELKRIQKRIMLRTNATFASEAGLRRGLGCTNE